MTTDLTTSSSLDVDTIAAIYLTAERVLADGYEEFEESMSAIVHELGVDTHALDRAMRAPAASLLTAEQAPTTCSECGETIRVLTSDVDGNTELFCPNHGAVEVTVAVPAARLSAILRIVCEMVLDGEDSDNEMAVGVAEDVVALNDFLPSPWHEANLRHHLSDLLEDAR